jgi:hypothetical protein
MYPFEDIYMILGFQVALKTMIASLEDFMC